MLEAEFQARPNPGVGTSTSAAIWLHFASIALTCSVDFLRKSGLDTPCCPIQMWASSCANVNNWATPASREFMNISGAYLSTNANPLNSSTDNGLEVLPHT